MLPFLDAGAIFLGFVLAYWLRNAVEIPKTSVYMWPFSQYATFAAAFLPVWMIIFALEGLYSFKKPKTGLSAVSSIFLASLAGMAVMVAWLFFSRFLFFSRLTMIYAWVLVVLLVYLFRFVLRQIQRLLYKKGIGVRKTLVVGESQIAKKICDEIKNNSYLGLKLSKKIDRAGVDKIERIFEKTRSDEIILADPNISKDEAEKLMLFCEANRVGFKMVPDFFRMRTTNLETDILSSYPLLSLKITPLEGWGHVFKRLFDLCGAFVGLLVLSPLFLILAILIKLDSRGPVFFKHQRAGSGGKSFCFYKFRSMIEEAPKMYTKLAPQKGLFLSKIKQDPRITKLGRFLRRTNLDELAQLFNVLKGEMSLVGPRPLTVEEFRHVSNFEKKYLWVSYVKPGMTGLWQVTRRNDYSHEQRAALDIYYVENWSPILDLWILLKTPAALFSTEAGS